jgi:hypothetical protein
MKFKPMNFSLNGTVSLHKNGMKGEVIGSRPMEKEKEFNLCFDNFFSVLCCLYFLFQLLNTNA